jgi:predicted nucleotidyltransferase component of viral defense system
MELSKEFGLAPHIIEKDYILGWIIAGISKNSAICNDWVFKGGTCLKKCYFETYRFSEDLDFTLKNSGQLDEQFLAETFKKISEWVYDVAGVELPKELIRFDVYQNPREKISVQGRVGYKGPLGKGGDLPRIKLDLTADEALVLEPVQRQINHTYSDCPEEGIHVLCYSFEEVFAEKIRALAERERPRDLYDVIHLYRHGAPAHNREKVLEVLQKKCAFKNISLPTVKSLQEKPERNELESEWKNMLAHQLPVLPSFEQFWEELPQLFDWLYKSVEEPVRASISFGSARIDSGWSPPQMSQQWGIGVPLEPIRFAGANHLCVNLGYDGTKRLIEPYSLKKTLDGNIILAAVKHATGEPRSYRIDRIESVEVTSIQFIPKYSIDLTTIEDTTSQAVSFRQPAFKTPGTRQRLSSFSRSGYRTSQNGPKYVFKCPYCGKKFAHSENSSRLNAHKDKNGYPCYGRTGYFVETKY